MYWLCEHTTILQPRKPNAIPRCVKWDLTALHTNMKSLHTNMKSISLAKLGLNEVYGGELIASPSETKMYHCTNLNVEPNMRFCRVHHQSKMKATTMKGKTSTPMMESLAMQLT
ncbi:hypothetical protein CsSME_00017979 [Camellia sinensis var. sinensis]